MLIECAGCEAFVDAKLIGSHKEFDEDVHDNFNTYFLECPRCKSSILAGKWDFEEGPPSRLWPKPENTISWSIPEIIRTSIEEAMKCFKAGAYSACAVMCGRSLEGVCHHFGTKHKYLGPGLKELLDNGIIDKRLFKWAEELQQARNISAHATGEKITKVDARDLLDFVNAICEYVFVLTEKYDNFIKRKEILKSGKKNIKKDIKAETVPAKND